MFVKSGKIGSNVIEWTHEFIRLMMVCLFRHDLSHHNFMIKGKRIPTTKTAVITTQIDTKKRIWNGVLSIIFCRFFMTLYDWIHRIVEIYKQNESWFLGRSNFIKIFFYAKEI